MPAKPGYFHELTATVEVISERVDSLRVVVADQKSDVDSLRKELHETRERLAKIESQFADASKRLESWDTRIWGLVAILIGALLSLASGLAVALLKH